MKLVWDENAWDDYLWWQAQDRKVLKRINSLITTSRATGTRGSVSPSRSSTDSRATGRVASTTSTGWSTRWPDDEIRIAACRYHYGL